ncbi:unnamed protein product [Arabidopsis halleri]
MTKNTALTIFIVLFVIGMVMEETQGKTCHDYIQAEHCEINQCNQECSTKWKGVGVKGSCEPPGFEPLDQTCLCSFNCGN